MRSRRPITFVASTGHNSVTITESGAFGIPIPLIRGFVRIRFPGAKSEIRAVANIHLDLAAAFDALLVDNGGNRGENERTHRKRGNKYDTAPWRQTQLLKYGCEFFIFR